MAKEIVLYLTEKPFGERRKVILPFVENETVGEAIRRASNTPFNTVYGDIDSIVEVGGTYHAWNMPKDPVSSFFASLTLAGVVKGMLIAVGVALVSTGIQFAMSKIFQKKVKGNYNKPVDDMSDTQYGWDYNAMNAEAEGAPIPVLYGRRAVIPPILAQHAEADGKNGEYLYVTFGVADAGGGFSDVISYPPNNDGLLQAWLAHAFWTNYFAGNSSTDALLKNRLYTQEAQNPQVLMHADITDISNVTGDAFAKANDGVTKGGGSVQYDATGFGNIYFELAEGVRPTRCNVYTYIYEGSAIGLTSGKLYGYDAVAQQWDELGTVKREEAVSVGWYRCVWERDGIGDGKYTKFYIGDLHWVGTPGGQFALCEIEIFGPKDGETAYNYAQLRANGGSYEQEPVDFATRTWGKLEVNKTLDTTDFVFQTTPGARPNRLMIHLNFPYGLYGFDNNTGELVSKTVNIAAYFRRIEADGTRSVWYNFWNRSSSSSATKAITADQNTALNYSFSVLTSATPAYYYEVKVRFAQEPEVGTGEAAECVWDTLEEGWDFVCAYPRTATVGFKLLASKVISGVLPQFKVIAERNVVNVWNSVAEEWEERPANNPAWAAWDLLCHPRFDDRELESPNDDDALLSEQMPHTSLVYSDFKKWADFCDEEGISISIYFDGNMTIRDALQYICDVGRASIITRGSKVGVVCDKPADVIDGRFVTAFDFDYSNVIADSWKVSYRSLLDMPHQVQVTYYDKERQWNRFAIVMQDREFEAGQQLNTKEVTLYACDDKAVAAAYARYFLNLNMIRRTFEWKGDIGTLPLDVGDMVSLFGDYVTITSVSQDDDFHRTFQGMEYVRERQPVAEKYTPLCLIAAEAGSAVTLTAVGTPAAISLEYSYDGRTWQPYSIGQTIFLQYVGDMVFFRGDNSAFSGSSNYYQFVMAGKIKAAGNLMSLLDSTCESVTIPTTYCFSNLFRNTPLITTPLMPAKNTTNRCYANCYNGCVYLVSASDLPAPTLTTYCYLGMFSGCPSLVKGPVIGATGINGTGVCYEMFNGCTSLEVAPALGIRGSSVNNVFYAMFNGCTKLCRVEVSFANWPSGSNATQNWLRNVAASGVFVCPSTLDTTIRDASHIPEGWTVETYEPPVATLSQPAFLAGFNASATDAPDEDDLEDDR